MFHVSLGNLGAEQMAVPVTTATAAPVVTAAAVPTTASPVTAATAIMSVPIVPVPVAKGASMWFPRAYYSERDALRAASILRGWLTAEPRLSNVFVTPNFQPGPRTYRLHIAAIVMAIGTFDAGRELHSIVGKYILRPELRASKLVVPAAVAPAVAVKPILVQVATTEPAAAEPAPDVIPMIGPAMPADEVRPGMPTWAWITIGAGGLIVVGGVVTGIVLATRRPAAAPAMGDARWPRKRHVSDALNLLKEAQRSVRNCGRLTPGQDINWCAQARREMASAQQAVKQLSWHWKSESVFAAVPAMNDQDRGPASHKFLARMFSERAKRARKAGHTATASRWADSAARERKQLQVHKRQAKAQRGT